MSNAIAYNVPLGHAVLGINTLGVYNYYVNNIAPQNFDENTPALIGDFLLGITPFGYLGYFANNQPPILHQQPIVGEFEMDIDVLGFIGYPNPPIYTDLISNKTSILIQSQLPEFIRNNYPTFVAFLEAYYEYLEQTGKVTSLSKNLPNMLDVDYVFDNDMTDFIELFRKQYLIGIPLTVLANKALLIKHIRDFYTSKGTIKSFKFLFRILFDEDVDVFNTGNQVLIASGGKWYQAFVLRVQTSNNLSDFVNTQIFGQNSLASAIVDTVSSNFTNGISYKEITLNNITGKFIPNEVIISKTKSGATLYGRVVGSISDIDIVTQGHFYNIGDPVLISGSGGANAVVSEVTAGGLSSLSIVQAGAGFQTSPTFSVGIASSGDAPLAIISTVDTSGTVAPNNYILSGVAISPSTNIATAAIINQTIGTINYSCGPLAVIQILSGGSGINPSTTVFIDQALPIGTSTVNIIDYGSIGRFTIINGGVNYNIGDDVKIISITSRGVSGAGKVISVDANGSITSVLPSRPTITGNVSIISGNNSIVGLGTIFTKELTANNDASYPGSGSILTVNNTIVRVMTIANDTFMTVNANFSQTATNQVAGIHGFMLGGIGYQTSDFPYAARTQVLSSTGVGAIIQPTCILGDGAKIQAVTDSDYGAILKIKISNFGDRYITKPTVDLSHSGDGTATAEVNFIDGIFQYPGYFKNEDGMLSSRRYLQDSNTYNSYSYILKSPIPVNKYQRIIQDLLSPVGTHMIGITTVVHDSIPIAITSSKYISTSI